MKGRSSLHPYLLDFLRSGGRRAARLRDDEARALVQAAAAERLAPLLLKAWSDGRVRPPAPAVKELRTAAARSSARGLAVESELASALDALGRRGVRAAPLRGPALGEALFGDPALSPTGDVDLLVRRADIPAVREALGALGYREAEPRPGFALEFDYTLELFKAGPLKLILEPHWSLAYPPFVDALDMAAVWGRARPSSFKGRPCFALAAEDLLLHLCLHHLHHAPDAPLLWLLQIDRLVRGGMDWPLLFLTAGGAGLGPLVRPALALASETCGTPLPEGWEERLSGALVRARERRAYRLVVDRAGLFGAERIAHFLALDGLAARWRYLLGYLLPDAAFLREQYGLEPGGSPAAARLRRLAGLVARGWGALRRSVMAEAGSAPGGLERRVEGEESQRPADDAEAQEDQERAAHIDEARALEQSPPQGFQAVSDGKHLRHRLQP